MVLLFRLPALLLELLLRRLFGRDEHEERFATATTTPTTTTATTATPTATAPAPTPSGVAPPTPLRPIADGHLDDDAELVGSFGPADDVGATITVEEPWDGYAGQPAAAVVARLRGADPATRAVVALYERGHKNRASVLRAAG